MFVSNFFSSIFSRIITNNKKWHFLVAISSLITIVVAIRRMVGHVHEYWSQFSYLKIKPGKFQLITSLLRFLFATRVKRPIDVEKTNTSCCFRRIEKFIERFLTPKRFVVWLRGYLCVKWAVLCFIVYLNFKWIVFPINRILCWRIRNAKLDRRIEVEGTHFVTANQIKRIRCK